jgi:membrane fusion protein, multidrug efflux system
MTHTTSRQRLTVALTLTASALMLMGCSKAATQGQDAAKASPEKTEAPRPVRSIRVTTGAIDGALFLPAEVKPRFEQRYGFRVPGKVAKRLVDVGQTVAVGQVLAVMDSSDVLPGIAAQNAQVEAARTEMVLQQSELKRVQELSDKGFVSGAALDRQMALTQAANARFKAAQSQGAVANNSLAFQTLRADRAGVVTGIDAEVGSVVGAGQTVVRVSQTGEKELQVSVPERSVDGVRTAKSIVATADAVPGKIYSASLRELAPSADPASRTYAARLSLPQADEALRWGMSATVRIAINDAQGFIVPNSALYTRDSTPRVWVVDRSTQTVQPVVVKLGVSSDTGVAVTAGLKDGDTVVTAGSNLLQPGQKVRLLDAAVSKP